MRWFLVFFLIGCASSRFVHIEDRDDPRFGLCAWCVELEHTTDKCGIPDECLERCPRE
jgi:hypothetical protein